MTGEEVPAWGRVTADYGVVRETGARKGTRQRGFVRKDKGCSRKSQEQCSIHVQTQQRQRDGGWETVSFQ